MDQGFFILFYFFDFASQLLNLTQRNIHSFHRSPYLLNDPSVPGRSTGSSAATSANTRLRQSASGELSTAASPLPSIKLCLWSGGHLEKWQVFEMGIF